MLHPKVGIFVLRMQGPDALETYLQEQRDAMAHADTATYPVGQTIVVYATDSEGVYVLVFGGFTMDIVAALHLREINRIERLSPLRLAVDNTIS